MDRMDVQNLNLKTALPGPARAVSAGGPHDFMFAELIDGLFAPGAPAAVPRPDPRGRPEAAADEPPAEPTESTPARARPRPPRPDQANLGGEQTLPMAATVADVPANPPLAATVAGEAAPAPEPIAAVRPSAIAPTAAGAPLTSAPLAAPAPTEARTLPDIDGTAKQSVDPVASASRPEGNRAPAPTTAGPETAAAPAVAAVPESGIPHAPVVERVGTERQAPTAAPTPDRSAARRSTTPNDTPPTDASARETAAIDMKAAADGGEDRPVPIAFRRAGHPGSAADGPAAGSRPTAPEGAGDKPAPQVTPETLAALIRPAASAPRNPTMASTAGRIGGETFATQLAAGDGREANLRARLVPPPAPARTPPPPAPALDQIALHIRRAAAEGLDRIHIQLKPAELGRVDVRLEIGRDHRVAALVIVDRQETLDLLLRDARGLERALEQAGLNPGSGNLEFSLGGQGSGGFASTLDAPDRAGGDGAPDPAPADLPPPTWASNALLDIQV